MPDNYVSIDGYLIDAALSEGHAFEAEVTDYPVEQGADITDNMRIKPAIVTITGIVSDTPLGPLVEQRANEAQAGSVGLPSDAALAKLLEIQNSREPVTIITSRKLFDDMLLQHLDVPVDAKTGNALRFTAVFKQVVIVTNDRQLVRVAAPQVAGGTTKLGHIPAKEAPGFYAADNLQDLTSGQRSLLGEGVDQLGAKKQITAASLGLLNEDGTP
nr:hypothetical protein [Kofleriaceae bacterium]